MNETTVFLYRGVSADHPAITWARRGVCTPGNAAGIVQPSAHNAGGLAEFSAFTSWSHRLEVAMSHAQKGGPGGVVLRALAGTPPPGSTWYWAASPDVWYESEVLLWGRRDGLEVLMP